MSPELSAKYIAGKSVTRVSGTDFLMYGGERGIRTLDGLLTHTPLAGERLQPLGHLSVNLILPEIWTAKNRDAEAYRFIDSG